MPESTSSNTMQRVSRAAQETCTASERRERSQRLPGVRGNAELDLVDAVRRGLRRRERRDLDLEAASGHAQRLHAGRDVFGERAPRSDAARSELGRQRTVALESGGLFLA